MHIGDQLQVVLDLPNAELAGVFDTQPERMARVCADLGIRPSLQHVDHERCLATEPDLVLVCSSTAEHADWTLRAAPYDVHVMLEKPFAHDLAAADAMIDAVTSRGRELTVNWPLTWYPAHRTLRRLIAEGALGRVVELHYYDGNRGPLFHEHGKREIDPEEVRAQMGDSWWYRRDRGGGSMLDYLGYGTTLATWFLDGEAPLEVTATQFVPDGLEVDTHSLVAARYAAGLSTFQTRWGTFTDPWTLQPWPRTGFVVAGTAGTAASFDYADAVHVQTEERPEGFDVPADEPERHERTAIAYLLHCLERGEPVDGPTGWRTSRTGQRIVDAARLSAERRSPVALDEVP
jgi:glucose-fructose oxidoreductase